MPKTRNRVQTFTLATEKNCITLFKESGFHILTVDRFVVSDLTGKSHRFITYVGLTRWSKNVAVQIFILMVQPIY